MSPRSRSPVFVDLDEACRGAIRKRVEQRRADHGEDRGAGADPQREAEDDTGDVKKVGNE